MREPTDDAEDAADRMIGPAQLEGAGAPEIATALVNAMRNTGASVVYQGTDLRVAWAANLPASFANGEDVTGKTDSEFLPPEQAGRLEAVKRSVLETGDAEWLELKLVGNGIDRWFDVWVDPDHGRDGEVTGLVTTIQDVTEQKRRENTLRALLREVSHRSKNLLAVIQSVALQTGRYSGTIDGFLVRFRGRIQSLAASQDLVTSSNWRGAELYELIVEQVARYSEHPALSVAFDGENPHLNPNAAIHVGLAIHELAVNSVSFGALSRPDGRIGVSCRRDGDGLVLEWHEEAGTPADTERQKRFGSVALERVVPAALDGTSRLVIEGGLVTYTLTIPAGNFERT